MTRSRLAPIALSCLLLAAWEAEVRLGRVNALILPAPSQVLVAASQNVGVLGRAISITMLEAVLGFAVATVSAMMLAVVFVRSRSVKAALYPYAIVLKATPIIAVAPLVVLWAGNGLLSKVVLAALVAFFPVLVTAVQGLAAVDEEVLDLMRSVDASWWTVLWRIRVPGSLPYVFSGLRVGSTLSVVGAVIGEFTGATEGAGHLITVSSYYLDTPLMFAAVGCTAFGGLALFGAIALAETRVVFWKKQSWE